MPIIAKHRAYQNTRELLYTDPDLTSILGIEFGGSAGMWPSFAKLNWGFNEQEQKVYFDLIDDILSEFR